ncbi:hypothetical protein JB92DRAFT_3103344 [Gautieria morchelliformis]|nr:hypothetical protein JB92DRAFT_3103344 [Gautieria morchelliformis]
MSVWQFRTNPAPSSAVFSIRFSADGESPANARHETAREVEHNPRHVQSETVQYQPCSRDGVKEWVRTAVLSSRGSRLGFGIVKSMDDNVMQYLVPTLYDHDTLGASDRGRKLGLEYLIYKATLRKRQGSTHLRLESHSPQSVCLLGTTTPRVNAAQGPGGGGEGAERLRYQPALVAAYRYNRHRNGVSVPRTQERSATPTDKQLNLSTGKLVRGV